MMIELISNNRNKKDNNQFKRLNSIDALRGLVMIVMALDHVRYFFHKDALVFSPEDLTKTNALLFFTRWVTHFCAPVFIMLAGTGAYLQLNHGKSKRVVSKFLLLRGLWLIFLELTLFHFAWDFNFFRPAIELIVIWAIGISMIFLAIAIYLPLNVIFVLSLLILFSHNLTDTISFEPGSSFQIIWGLLHQPGLIPLWFNLKLVIVYPVLPYFGLILLGFTIGRLFGNKFNSKIRRSILLYGGISCILLFVLFRFYNIYGDPNPWTRQSDFILSSISFLKTTKYPVSLLYCLMTIGPSLLVLVAFEQVRNSVVDFLVIIGKVPLFYYILHLFLIHGLALLTDQQNNCTLTEVYFVWLLVVVILFFPCRWYMLFKSKNILKYPFLSFI